MSLPDIQKGGNSYIKYIGFAVGVFSLVGVGAFVIKGMDETEETGNHRNLIKSSGLPEGFFYQEEKEIVNDNLDDIEAEEEAKVKAARLASRNYRPKKKVVKKLSAKEIFRREKIKQEAWMQIKLRDKINSERRKSGYTRVATSETLASGSRFKKTVDDSVDKDWSSYGVKSDQASFPTDLSRVITVDRLIPCLLVQEILTDLGGQISCQVEENIYGGHGRKVLIPAGSKAVGRFTPLKKVGDERVRAYWSRVITPEGININTTRAELTDTMGRTGATAEIDKRYFEKYGAALLFSTISSLAAFQVPVASVNEQIVISNFTKDLSNTSSKILEETINIKPRGRVAAGTRIFINPVRDIRFSKPRNKTIKVSTLEKNK